MVKVLTLIRNNVSDTEEEDRPGKEALVQSKGEEGGSPSDSDVQGEDGGTEGIVVVVVVASASSDAGVQRRQRKGQGEERREHGQAKTGENTKTQVFLNAPALLHLSCDCTNIGTEEIRQAFFSALGGVDPAINLGSTLSLCSSSMD